MPSRLNIKVVAFVGFLFFALGSAARADTVIVKLNNGDRLTGQLLSQDTNQVTIATPWAKQLSIPLSEIDSWKTFPAPTNAPVVVLTPNAPTAGSSANAVTAAKTPPPPATNAVPTLTVTVALRPALPQGKKDGKWHGDIQVGTDLEFASTSHQIYYGKIKLTYAKDIFRNAVEYNAAYGLTEGIVSDNRMDGSVKTEFDLGKRLYTYNLAGGGYNQIQLIRMQFQEGPGMGYHIFKAADKVLDGELGMDYQVRSLVNDGTDRRIFFRIAELYAWQVNSRVSLDEKVEYFPLVEDPTQYRFRAEANIHYNLLKHVTLNFSVVEFYDTQPAVGAEHSDLQVRSSLGVTF